MSAAGLSTDVVYSIAGQRDVWIGRQRGGLTHLREANGAWTATAYTQADGLAQNSVYAVHQSRDGTVWAGTLSGGVSRFNGGQFTTFTTADGLSSNTISSIAEGPDGTIWFGTPNGVSAYAHGRWQSFAAKDGLPAGDVACLTVDAAGVAWVGTANGLAFVSGGRVGVPTNAPAVLAEPIAGLAADERGSMWIATSNHVLRAPRDQLLGGELTDAGLRCTACPTDCTAWKASGVTDRSSPTRAAGSGSRSAAGSRCSISRPLRPAPRRRSYMSSPSRPTASRSICAVRCGSRRADSG